MLRLLVATLFFFSAEGCNRPGGFGIGRDQCKLALAPTYAEQQLDNAASTTCIAEQTGLQAIIDGLRSPFRVKLTPFLSSTLAIGSKHLLSVNKCKDVATLLETNGYTTEATTLRTCTARERGMLRTDGTYDMDKLKADILAKVTGLPVQTNTELGLTGCPNVVEFDVAEYMECITSYCRTGAAP